MSPTNSVNFANSAAPASGDNESSKSAKPVSAKPSSQNPLSLFVAAAVPTVAVSTPETKKSVSALPTAEAKKIRLSENELVRLKKNEPVFTWQTEFGTVDFVRAGNPNGPTILLIPGTPGQNYDFHRLIPLLAKLGYDVLAITPPGKGHSIPKSFPFEKGLDAYAQFLGKVFTDFELKDVTVLGFSCGFSEISQAISTGKVPADKVARLVSVSGWAPLFAPNPIKEGEDKLLADPNMARAIYPMVWSSGMFSNETLKVFVTLPAEQRIALVTEYLKGLPNPPAAANTNAEIAERFQAQLTGYSLATKTQYDVNGRQAAYFSEGATGRKAFKMPLLAIVGDLDEVVLYPNNKNAVPYAESYFKTYSDLNPSAKNKLLQYSQAGHMIPYEWADKLAEDIHRFITTK